MQNKEVKAVLEWISDHIDAPEMQHSRKNAALDFLLRLSNHTEVISTILEMEALESEPVRFKAIRIK